MRHVRQEFGLVLGGERQFRRLFLKSAPGLFDLLILALDLGVLLGKLLRFLLELLVGELKLLLLGLKLRRELLRLLHRPSVCMVASMLFSTMPMPAVN